MRLIYSLQQISIFPAGNYFLDKPKFREGVTPLPTIDKIYFASNNIDSVKKLKNLQYANKLQYGGVKKR